MQKIHAKLTVASSKMKSNDTLHAWTLLISIAIYFLPSITVVFLSSFRFFLSPKRLLRCKPELILVLYRLHKHKSSFPLLVR